MYFRRRAVVFRTRSGRVIVFTVVFHFFFLFSMIVCVCLWKYYNDRRWLDAGIRFSVIRTRLCPRKTADELATTIINIIIIVTLCVHIIITHGVLCYKTGTPPCSIRGLLPSSFDNNYRRLEQHGRRLSIVCGAFVWFSS